MSIVSVRLNRVLTQLCYWIQIGHKTVKRLKQILLDYSTPQHYYMQRSIKEFSKKVKSVFLLMDIGCGYSPFLKMFLYKKKVLVDLKRLDNVDLVCDATALGIKERCVDLIICTEVLEHIPDEKVALQELKKILCQGGWLIISVPFLFGSHEKFDYRRWTANGLRRLLEEIGFDIIDFQCRGGIFSSLIVLWRNMPKDILGGNYRSPIAKVLYPVILLHLVVCTFLTPLVILLDRVDKLKASTTGYIVLCKKPK